MSARTAARRRRQAVNGYKHIARLGRPIYKATASTSVAQAIERERRLAAAEARRRTKK